MPFTLTSGMFYNDAVRGQRDYVMVLCSNKLQPVSCLVLYVSINSAQGTEGECHWHARSTALIFLHRDESAHKMVFASRAAIYHLHSQTGR